jgi:adenosylcobinamide-phosphate guanylyltransferase
MKGTTEKPLLQVSGKSMLERIVEVLKQVESVDRIVVASSPNTPATAIAAKTLDVEVIVTSGQGFEEDMRFAIRKLSLGPVLIVSSDIPFINPRTIQQAVEMYQSSGKPALAVMAPVELYRKLGSKPEHIFHIHGQDLVPIGINILDGKRIDEGELDQVEMLVDSEDLTINVNTTEDLQAARRRVGGSVEPSPCR